MSKDGAEPWVVGSLYDVARFFKVTFDTVRKAWKPRGMPGKPGAYDLSEIVDWWKDSHGPKRAKTDANGDPLLEGEATPALEQYRLAKAGQEEIKLAMMRGQSVDVETLRRGLSRMAGIIREAGESIQRQFGTEAHAILEDAMDDAERVMDGLFNDRTHEDGESGTQ